jgi:hypothetical protein
MVELGIATTAELHRLGELIEVVRNNPGQTRSGTCPLCESLEGEPVDEVGFPPFHTHCACDTQSVQMTRQPGDLLAEEFDMEPPPEEEPDPGGVTTL